MYVAFEYIMKKQNNILRNEKQIQVKDYLHQQRGDWEQWHGPRFSFKNIWNECGKMIIFDKVGWWANEHSLIILYGF